jgi:hypothetical protein
MLTPHRNPLWARADRELTARWQACSQGTSDAGAFGLISSRDNAARYTHIDIKSAVVTKLPLGPQAHVQIRSEIDALTTLQTLGLEEVAPALVADSVPGWADALATEFIGGATPHWTNLDALFCAMQSLTVRADVLPMRSCPGCRGLYDRWPGHFAPGIQHGDFTAWNVRIREQGQVKIIDWESFARERIPNTLLALEWLFRGCAVSRSSLALLYRALVNLASALALSANAIRDAVRAYECVIAERRDPKKGPVRDDGIYDKVIYLIGAIDKELAQETKEIHADHVGSRFR